MTETVTIYHNPRCSKSRAALELLQRHELDVTVIEYLKTPVDRTVLTGLLKMLDLTPRELMRRGEAPFRDLNLGNAELTDDQLIDAILEHPILIERPIVVYDQQAAIGRPLENIIDMLDS